jgi:hypothetical protein
MAKYEDVFLDTQNLYTKLIVKSGLSNNLNIVILTDNRAKDIFKVTKANALLKHRAGDDVIVVINEKIFDKLTAEQKEIVAEESLASIGYDLENDKLIISKPDVVTWSGLIEKHTFAKWNVLRETIKSLYHAEEELEDKIASSNKKGKKQPA